MNPIPSVNRVSECFIKPKYITEESKQPFYMTPWELSMLSSHYIEMGLVYSKPPESKYNPQEFMSNLLDRLKKSLSVVLVYFYPFAGRFVTVKYENPSPSCVIYVDCNNSPGAKFIHSTVDLKLDDILSPNYVPEIFYSFFDHHNALNYDGHTLSLLSVQINELIDGVFLGCSVNHCVSDGTNYWNFLNMWSEIFNSDQQLNGVIPISCPPNLERWCGGSSSSPIIRLPFTHEEQFINRTQGCPQVKCKFFQFSAKKIAQLKARTNLECNTNQISSLQSLCALVWRCVTRARNLPPYQTTKCNVAINNRKRLDPPASQYHFGNLINEVSGVATAKELVENGVGWAAWLLNQAVANHTEEVVSEWANGWLKSHSINDFDHYAEPNSLLVGNSPRSKMYENEFGLGKPLVIRSGFCYKFDGLIWAYPGRGGADGIEFEICLLPNVMRALEADNEFMNFVNHVLHSRI